METRWLALVGALLLGLAGCASGGPTKSTVAPGADIPAYGSFGWLPAGAGAAGASEQPPSIAETNLRSAIRKELAQKGYREVEANPDFRVGFETQAQLKEKTTPPISIGVGVGSWGGHVGTEVGTSVPVGSGRVTTSALTQITIRAVDARSNQEVWVGSTTREIQPGSDASVVEKAVADVMDGFPARRR